MTPTLRRSLLAASMTAFAAAGLLAGCERTTTSQTPDGTSSTTTTTTVQPAPTGTTAATVQSTAKDVGNDAKQAMNKAGNAVEDGVITAKVKTALLADPAVKGLKIDVDTKDGVVTLSGTVEKNANLDRAVSIARATEGVKSVDNQLVVKSA